MSIKKVLEQLGATKKNVVWSWGAVDDKMRRVYLQVWKHQFAKFLGRRYIEVGWDNIENLGAKERWRHFDLISKEGYAAYGILCTVKDPNEETWEIAEFDSDNLLRLGEFRKKGRETYIEVLGTAPISSLTSMEIDTRSRERLPVTELEKVNSEHVLKAVKALIGGAKGHGFGKSTDYDLVTDEGVRLPPKAVFGLALSNALGFNAMPKHFYGGEGSPCFRILRRFGCEIIPKDASPTVDELEEKTTEPVVKPPTDWESVITLAPSAFVLPSRKWTERGVKKEKREKRERNHAKIGAEGELWVVGMERARLKNAGQEGWETAVVHASIKEGDGLGYDIRSIDDDGNETYIEVKTTTCDANEPFNLTANEMKCSEENPQKFRLYRVYGWGRQPRVYVLQGSMAMQLQMEARQWICLPLAPSQKPSLG